MLLICVNNSIMTTKLYISIKNYQRTIYIEQIIFQDKVATQDVLTFMFHCVIWYYYHISVVQIKQHICQRDVI